MSNLPKKDSPYHIPHRYNYYLISKLSELTINGSSSGSNLRNMLEHGRHNGEIMRDVEEYISCLNYECYWLRGRYPLAKIMDYEQFVRESKINDMLLEDELGFVFE